MADIRLVRHSPQIVYNFNQISHNYPISNSFTLKSGKSELMTNDLFAEHRPPAHPGRVHEVQLRAPDGGPLQAGQNLP